MTQTMPNWPVLLTAGDFGTGNCAAAFAMARRSRASTRWNKKGNKTMGWLSVLLGAIAAFLFYKTAHLALMILAIIAALGNFWSWGVMHNYATELAKRRQNYKGGFYDITRQEAKAVPDWISWTNMGFSIAGLILLIIGIIMLIKR